MIIIFNTCPVMMVTRRCLLENTAVKLANAHYRLLSNL